MAKLTNHFSLNPFSSNSLNLISPIWPVQYLAYVSAFQAASSAFLATRAFAADGSGPVKKKVHAVTFAQDTDEEGEEDENGEQISLASSNSCFSFSHLELINRLIISCQELKIRR